MAERITISISKLENYHPRSAQPDPAHGEQNQGD